MEQFDSSVEESSSLEAPTEKRLCDVYCYIFVNYSVTVTYRTWHLIQQCVWWNVCFQEEVDPIPHSELAELKAIGQGRDDVAYQAEHEQLDTSYG